MSVSARLGSYFLEPRRRADSRKRSPPESDGIRPLKGKVAKVFDEESITASFRSGEYQYTPSNRESIKHSLWRMISFTPLLGCVANLTPFQS